MSNKKEHFLQEVLNYIKSKEAKELVKKELTYHLDQSRLDLVSKGIEETVAEKQAVVQMGSAIELGQQFNRLYRPKIDWILLGLFLATILMGLLPLLKVEEEHFILTQSVYIIMGVVVATAVMFVDYRKWNRFGWVFLGLGLLLLWGLNYTPSVTINGVGYLRIWNITISGATVIPILLLFWASYLSMEKPKLWVVFGVYLYTVYLFMRLPNLPETMIYTGLVFALFCNSAMKRKVIFATVAGTLGLFITSVSLLLLTAKDYQLIRLSAFFHPEKYADNAGYMYLRVKDLLAGGGWLGNGDATESTMEQVTDLVFANFTYYYGWLLAGVLVLLLASILFRVLQVSNRIKDGYGRQLIIGVCSLFIIQMVYNIGMILGLLPIISISLPFISYGMTPTVLNAFLVGIVLSVYRRKDLVVIMDK